MAYVGQRRNDHVPTGARDKWVYLVPITDSTGSSGFPVETDAISSQWIGVWASREDVGGRERFAAQQVSAPYDTRWGLPYAAAFDPDVVNVPKVFALMHKSRRHDIVAAQVIGRSGGVELLTLARNG